MKNPDSDFNYYFPTLLKGKREGMESSLNSSCSNITSKMITVDFPKDRSFSEK